MNKNMGRHYSTKDFFRQVPNSLLARYFQARGLFAEFDFLGMKETKIDALFERWLGLPDLQRSAVDMQFRLIFDLGCEKGFRAILDEAEWRFITLLRDPQAHTVFVEKLAAQSSHIERAMVVFLDHNEFCNGAWHFYHADTLPYWRKRKNLPHVQAAVDDGSLQRLTVLIRNYFHLTEGRGKNCVVEPFRRGELDYFFAYPEDFSAQSVEWVNGAFDRRPHNPAFEVVFVYSRREGSLDLNFRGSYKAVEPLQMMFADAILQLAGLPPDPDDERVYDLHLLRQRGFNFVFTAESGIQDIAVKKMRLSSSVKKGDRITLEADTAADKHAVYDLMEKIGRGMPLHLYHVTQVELAVSVVVDISKPAKTITVRITYPNSCSLKYDELDLRLRDMLHASGLEPKELVDPAHVLDGGSGSGA
jgi:hypothetical protein